jgi:hypothetical protein
VDEKNEIINNGQSGNWLSRQSTATKLILGIVGICCIGAIVFFAIGSMIPGMVNYEFNTNAGDMEVNDVTFSNGISVDGLKFYLPDGFSSYESSNNGGIVESKYSDGTDYITICVVSDIGFSETLRLIKNDGTFSNIKENVRYGGYSGFTADYILDDGTVSGVDGKMFVFEKDGKVVSVEMSTIDLNFNDVISKIIR